MKRNRTNDKRPAFTVVELLVVISILALLAAMTMSALANAAEQAKAQRTRAIIDKIDQLIMEKWNGYRTRAVPVSYNAADNPRQRATTRLNALRELMRMELPDRIGDLCSDAEKTTLTSVTEISSLDPNNIKRSTSLPVPSLARTIKRRASQLMTSSGQPWTTANEQAECLYLILACMRDGEKNALDFFAPDEIGNVDDDAIPEILDGWGEPIRLLRWAPGYFNNPTSGWAALTMQVRDGVLAPDPFDPLRVDARWSNTSASDQPFALTPLIMSPGPDKALGVVLGDFDKNDTEVHFRLFQVDHGNNPYLIMPKSERQLGELFVDSGEFVDNITNHYRGE